MPSGTTPLVVEVVGLPKVPVEGCRDWAGIHLYLQAGTPCYAGLRLQAGPPLVLNGILPRSLVAGDWPQRIDLEDVFLEFAGETLAYAARSSDPAVTASVEEWGCWR